MARAAHISEELANSLTHGFGLVLSLAGFPILIALAVTRGSIWHVVSCGIYGATLIVLYLASTLYHSLHSFQARRVLKVFDHCAIYLLIAGTYTPFTLVTLRGGWGWTLFGIIWGMAVLGIVFKATCSRHFPFISALIYVVMGWLAVIAIKPLVAASSLSVLAWLVAGGLAYTVGTAFFAAKKMRYNHALWHAFVVLGSICHYVAVVQGVLTPRT